MAALRAPWPKFLFQSFSLPSPWPTAVDGGVSLFSLRGMPLNTAASPPEFTPNYFHLLMDGVKIGITL